MDNQKSVKQLIHMFENIILENHQTPQKPKQHINTVTTLDATTDNTSTLTISPLPSSSTIATNRIENLESITLIWYDPNIDKKDDTKETMIALREIIDHVVFHTDQQECIDNIKLIKNEKVLVITSGQCASSLLIEINPLRQVDSVFIFCVKTDKYQSLKEEFTKIVGIYCNRHELMNSIKEQIELVEKQLETFSFYHEHREKTLRNLSNESAAFLWFQMFKDVILRMHHDNHNARQQLIEFCRQYYRGNKKELDYIDEFERDYKENKAIEWYTRETFLYKMVNKALRTEVIDQLYIFRSFISDLSSSIAREYEKIKVEPIILYRGLKMEEEELLVLKQNEGQLISTNGFLSTTRSRSVALAFAMNQTKRKNVVAVLYEIECNINEVKSITLADIAPFSVFKTEQEVLFDLGATFRIVSVGNSESTDNLWVIKLQATDDGGIAAREYIEMNRKEYDETSLPIMFGKLLINMGKYEQSLKYFQNLLMENSQDEDLPQIYNKIGEIYTIKADYPKALEYYKSAMNCSGQVLKPPITISVSLNIAMLSYKMGLYDKSLESYTNILKLAEGYYGSEHLITASVLMNIGNVYIEKLEYLNAASSYQKCLLILIKLFPNEQCLDIAICADKIGNMCRLLGKFDGALDMYKSSLQLKIRLLPPEHNEIAQTYLEMGNVYQDKGDIQVAFGFYALAHAIYIKNFSIEDGHPDLAFSIRNIASYIETVPDGYDAALSMYRKLLETISKLLPSNHPYIAMFKEDIARVTSKMNAEQ